MTSTLFYDPADPQIVTNAKLSGVIAPILIAVGGAVALYSVFKGVRLFLAGR